MNNMKDIIHSTFGGRVRVRACGILIKEGAVLLLKHEGIGKNGYLWTAPGGGVEYGQTIETTLKREFKEECNIEINVEEFILLNEFLEPPLHAIELFFKVSYVSGELKIGSDPEIKEKTLSAFHYFSSEELSINKKNIQKTIFKTVKNL